MTPYPLFIMYHYTIESKYHSYNAAVSSEDSLECFTEKEESSVGSRQTVSASLKPMAQFHSRQDY